MDKIISNNLEYENNFFFKLIVLNFELFDVIILDIELFNVSGLEISLENFERIMVVDRV